MANPTTNFGWVMPTATDLVTDLPADFAVFGQGVDTSMAYLLGGTTGQILSKTSGTNMAFTWINNDQGDITGITATSPLTGGGSSGAITVGIQDATTSVKGSVQLSDSTSTTSSVLAATPTAVKAAYDLADGAIAKTTVTTAGDVIYRNATVPARLGIGTVGQVLTVNSGATAPEWATPAVSSSSFVKITGTTFSAAASVTVDSCFTSTYKQYKVVITAIPSNTGQPVRVKMRYAAGTTDSTNYYYGGSGWQASNSTFTTNGSNATSFWLFSTSTARSSFAELTFSNVGSSSSVKPVWTSEVYDADYDAGYNLGCVNYTARTNWDGFIFTIDVGTMTGNYAVYGMEA